MSSLNTIELWLKQRHIFVDNEWLKACIQWIEEESQEQNVRDLKTEQLKTAVYGQWLFSDLREICTSSCNSSFPDNLQTVEKTVLNGNYIVQVMSVRDISRPAYGQLIKLQGKENENVTVSADPENLSAWEPKSMRMLMLNITDGFQSVQAMEYQSIPNLGVDVPPGIKLLVTGPVDCRLGVLMLTKEKVQILGGEVESLIEENAHEKILAKQLNRPDLVKTARTTKNCVTASVQPEVASVVQQLRTLPDEQNDDINDDFFDDDDDEMFMNLSADGIQDLEPQNNDEQNAMEEILDEEFIDLDEIELAEPENAWSDVEPQRRQTISETARTSDSGNFSHSTSDCDTTTSTKLSRGLSRSIPRVNENLRTGRRMANDSTLTSGTVGVYNTQSEKSFETIPRPENNSITRRKISFGADSCPFTYLHCILGQKPVSQPFVVKGFVSSLTSKLTIKPDTGWHLRALINDGSASLEVVISNEALSKFIGLTIEDINKLKADAKTDPSIKLKINEAITKCQENLMNLNCLMKIQLEPEATLIRCASVERYHIRQLLNRILDT